MSLALVALIIILFLSLGRHPFRSHRQDHTTEFDLDWQAVCFLVADGFSQKSFRQLFFNGTEG